MSLTSAGPATCPRCAAQVEGRFCPQCGTPVDGAACAGCRVPLTPGAKFCHRCGTAAGAGPPVLAEGRQASAALPWAFAAIVLLAFGAYVAAQHFGALPPSPDGPAPIAAAPGAMGSNGLQPRAPDISNMSPEERADRLFNRIMAEYEQGNSEFVQNMAPMAFAAYQMLPQMDPLRRYDMGRIAEVTGALPLAGAHADTLLQANPNHLLGLALAARVAELQGNEAGRADFARRLIDAAPAELDAERSEYAAHRVDINLALAEAQRRAR